MFSMMLVVRGQDKCALSPDMRSKLTEAAWAQHHKSFKERFFVFNLLSKKNFVTRIRGLKKKSQKIPLTRSD